MNEPIQIELPTIFGMKTVNAWLFLEPEPVLIDCGEKTTASWNALNQGIEKLGITIQDIKKVIITHAHLDHMGQANQICQHSDATIYLSEYAYDWAVNLKHMMSLRKAAFHEILFPNISPATAQMVLKKFSFDYNILKDYWEEIPSERIEKFPMEGKILFGGVDWDIIHAPGHCINQVCFYHPETGYLLSADMILNMTPSPIIDAAIEPPHGRIKSLIQLINSFKKFQKLHLTKVFPGHYGVIENAYEMMEGHLGRIEMRKEHCYRLISEGIDNFEELLAQIYPNRMHPGTFFMLVGFLDILMSKNRIEAVLKDGILKYYPKTSEK